MGDSLLVRVKVDTVQPRTGFFLEDPVLLSAAFMEWLKRVR